MRRILFVASRGDGGAGGENYLVLLIRHLDRRRFQPIVLLPKNGTLVPPLRDMGAETVVEEADEGWLERSRPWYRVMEAFDTRVRNCVTLIGDRRIDLVHTNSNYRMEAAMAAALCGVPNIYLAHIAYQSNMPIFQRFPLEHASYALLMQGLSTRIVAVSNAVAASLSPPIPSANVEVVHNGIEIEQFDAALLERENRIRDELQLPEKALLLAAVGRMAYDKGFDILLQAAERILPTARSLHIMLVGGDEDLKFGQQLRDQAHALPDADHIHFLGFRHDVRQILAEADIFALPSRREGHPYVLLEAMASECAIVAAKCPGVEDTVVDGSDGLLFEIGDSSALAEAVLRIASDDTLRHALASAARERVKRQFQARATAQRMMQIYAEVLNHPRPLPGSPGVELFLRATREIGGLGLRVTELEDRVRTLEQFMTRIQGNRMARLFRAALKPLRSHSR
jgi:glycosyltransferase involved in cell wall biosynthesis